MSAVVAFVVGGAVGVVLQMLRQGEFRLIYQKFLRDHPQCVTIPCDFADGVTFPRLFDPAA